MAELRTRKPTGKVAYPLILVVGPPKSGKTFITYQLAGSELVGRQFAIELGEVTADEYGSLGDFEIIEHNGTHGDIFEQIKAATAIPQADGKPNVISLDSGTALWDLQKHYADAKARSSKRSQEILKKDPDAEIETGMTAWTAAKDRWWEIINHLIAWDGITVITARLDVVTKVVDGRPVPNQTEESIQIEKGTPYRARAIVRVDHPRAPRLTAVQSLNVSIPNNGLELPADAALEHLVFRILGAGGSFVEGVVVSPALGIARADAMAIVKAEALKVAKGNDSDAKEIARAAWDAAGIGAAEEVTDAQIQAALATISDEPPAEGDEAPAAEEPAATEPEPEPTESPETPPDAPESAEGDPGPPSAEEGDPPAPHPVAEAQQQILALASAILEGDVEGAKALARRAWDAAGIADGVTEVTHEQLNAAIDALDELDPQPPEEPPADQQPPQKAKAPVKKAAKKAAKPAAADQPTLDAASA